MGPLITRPESRTHRLKLIEKRLRSQAPNFYADLKKAGMLTRFIDDEESKLMAAYAGWVKDFGYELGEEPEALPYIQRTVRKVKHPWLRALESLQYSDNPIFPREGP